MESGNTAFIPAGASGLASVAIPMAKAFGARVITSVLSDEIAEKIKNLGADIIINSTTQNTAEILEAEEKSGRPVNVSMDCLSGEMLGMSLPYMARGGYWVVISTLAGIETNIKLRPLLTKGLHLVGSMLRNRTPKFKAYILSELVDKVWCKIESGEIKPSIYKILPIEQAEEETDLKINSAYVTIPGKYITIVQNSVLKEVKDNDKLKKAIDAILANKDIIVYIDEIHMLGQVGNKDGEISLDFTGKLPGRGNGAAASGLKTRCGGGGGLWPDPAPAGAGYSQEGLHQYPRQLAAAVSWLCALSVGCAGRSDRIRRDRNVSVPGNGCRRYYRCCADSYRTQ